MDLATAGAVACPVCTLYLREGISLQRHLDTHPKEQVIEALIRASSSGQGQPATAALQSPVGPAVSPGVPTPTAAPAAAPAQAQPQYPMGLFECPPIMQPQFASFSYQQFVNNGTMMIPQYAMAPQNNQMMQMFYNPYGMYQHQQVPTVQMISPITPMPATTSMTTMSTMTARFRATSSTIEVPRSIAAPSIESASREPEHVEPESGLAEAAPPARPIVNEEPELEEEQRGQKSGSDDRLKDADNIYIVTNGQAEGESILPEITDEEIARSTGFKEPRYFYSNDCNSKAGEETQQQMEETVVRIEDGPELTGGEQVKDAREKVDEIMEAVVLEKEVETSKTIEEEEEQIGTVVEAREELEEQNEDEVIEMEPTKESEEPSSSVYEEDEQLERLLSNIIENELQQRHKGSDEHEDVENDHETSDVIAEELEEMALSTNDLSHSDDADSPYFQIYNYRKSQSVPSSPIALKKFHRTISRVSLCSDLDSVDNLCVYPEDLEGNALQECVGEERFDDLKNNMDVSDEFRDHYDEGEHDPELGQQPEHEEAVQSTVLESSKPSSPVSVRSFCNVEIDNSSRDVDEFVPADLSADNVPIDCSKPDKEKVEFQKSTEGIEEDYAEDKVINEDEAENSFAGSYPVMETESPAVSTSYPLNELDNSHNLMNMSESVEPLTSSDSSKSFHCKSQLQKPSAELLNISEDAHVGPVNVFEFDGLQILVPSTFISDSSQKAVSGTSQQSMASSEGGTNIDEEIKSVNMRADESMPSRGELSEQESNGCTEQSAWQLYMGQESSRVSTSYDLMARESWEESEGSDNEAGVPLLDSRSLATHFASSLFLDRDRKTPTRRTFKCSHCSEVFECPKERRVHITTAHKEASSSGRSGSSSEQHELKDIKILDGRTNVFEDIFTPGLHVQQAYHQQPLLHQLQPPQRYNAPKSDADQKIDGMGSATEVSCPVCSQRFVSEKSLQMHRRRMHETAGVERIREVSKCQICQEEFPSVVLFNSHLKIHPLECGQCGKYFYRKQNFKLHMKRHLGIKPFACTTCDKAFLTKQKLDEHMNGHTGNAPVKCNLCNETFRRYSNLTQHKNRHHLNIEKKLKDYICHCGEVFHTKKKLAWHKETHDEKPKACTYCNERFVHMASLTRHMRRAHNRRFVPDAQREVENVECPICKCIYLRSSLAVHMRVHNGERPYECQVCSKAFSTKWNLQLHKWTHAARSAKPFKCNQCSAAFYRHSDYTAHMNSHRNVRPYTCNYCGAQFIRKYNCLRHVKEHEENKAHTCEICKKTFHRSYYLKEHLRVHSGARPYSCHICGKSSSTKSNHNKHVRIHHAREPVNTEN